ncbi:MAG: HD domain-containing protein [Betaproteobacteria bacterium]|nr:HD domain-containing protein [Betaproteobacteria bacterium]
MVELAARLHDIGKIGVPDAILLKPAKLNDAERQIMRTHTTVGAGFFRRAIFLTCKWRKKLPAIITNGGMGLGTPEIYPVLQFRCLPESLRWPMCLTP